MSERLIKAWLLTDRIKTLLKKEIQEEKDEEKAKMVKDLLIQADMLSAGFLGLVEEILKRRTLENTRIERKEERKTEEPKEQKKEEIEKEKEEKATEAQIKYLVDLYASIGKPRSKEELAGLSKREASKLIEELKQKVRR